MEEELERLSLKDDGSVPQSVVAEEGLLNDWDSGWSFEDPGVTFGTVASELSPLDGSAPQFPDVDLKEHVSFGFPEEEVDRRERLWDFDQGNLPPEQQQDFEQVDFLPLDLPQYPPAFGFGNPFGNPFGDPFEENRAVWPPEGFFKGSLPVLSEKDGAALKVWMALSRSILKKKN
jgi:hypothetical protein